MAHIGHIDKEKQAAKTLEFFNREKDGFVRSACHSYTAGVPPEQTREALVRKIKSRMEDVLFEHLKRTVRREPRKSDVPSQYRDIEKILPNFQELVDSVLVEAGKLRMISAIEEATKKAQEEKPQSEQ